MVNYELSADEVILYENSILSDFHKSSKIILTSKKIIFEKTEMVKLGLLKSKTKEVIEDQINLDSIKVYNGKAQIKQKGSAVYIQTTEKNFTINFEGLIEARKFITKITDAITGTTSFKRGTEKVKETFNTVDDVLGFETRDAIKGVITNGVIGTILKGTKKNKK